MNQKKMWGLAALVLIVFAGVYYFSDSGNGSSGSGNSALAKCLSDSGAKFYGAYWCPHCNDQKAEFGSSASDLPYIECSLPNAAGQTVECQQAGITGYPTWVFADGSKVPGKLSLNQLAQLSGCNA